MIQDFFKSSDSPLSNKQVSLNFTRTSRQCQSNNKKPIQFDYINPQPDEIDFFTLIQQQNDQIQQWIEKCRNKAITVGDQQLIDQKLQIRIDKRNGDQYQIREQVLRQIKMLGNRLKGQGLCCVKCQNLKGKIQNLEAQLGFKQTQLIQNTKVIQYFKTIKLSLQQKNKHLQNQHKSFESLSKQFQQKSLQLNKIIQQKDKQINRLNQQMQRLQILQKSCLLQKSSSYNFKPRNSMQRSKSFLLSAAKNSTSHSQFNISNHLPKCSTSQQSPQRTPPTYQNPTHPSQFLLLLQKLKQTFLQQYKYEQKQYINKFMGMKDFQHMRNRNNQEVKGLVMGFRKGNRVYQLARGCKVLVQYVKGDKENFLGVISRKDRVIGANISSMANCGKHQSQKQTHFIHQDQKKKQFKLQSGLQSEIKNLNSQLQSLRKNLIRQKQQKKLLKQKLQGNKKCQKSSQQVLLQQQYHHLVLSHKQLQYNFQRQHKQRIKLEYQLQKYQQIKTIQSNFNRRTQPFIKPHNQQSNKQICQQKQKQIQNTYNVKKSLHRNSHSNSISPQPIDKQLLKRLRISSRSSLS